MIRILTIALAFLAITVLLASSFATLFPDSEGADNSSNTSIDDSVLEDAAPVQDVSNKFYRDVSLPNSERDFAADSIALIESQLTLSAFSQQASQLQVSNQLQAYVNMLDGGQEREDEVLEALSQAYREAAALGGNQDSLNTRSQDPNYVVNAMAEYLDADELTELELFLETSSKQQFIDSYGPQLEIISPTLSSSVKEVLLDTFFTEVYAATNPHGSLAPQNSAAFLARQQDAIQRTQDQLQTTLPAAEYALVNDFLNEQAAGIELAQSLFQQGN